VCSFNFPFFIVTPDFAQPCAAKNIIITLIEVKKQLLMPIWQKIVSLISIQISYNLSIFFTGAFFMGYFRENVEKAAGYTPGFQPKELDVIKLNTNENPYPPSPNAMKALAEIKSEQLRRYPDPLADTFRKAAGQVHNTKPENIMACNGGDELLSIAIRAFCDENRAVAYPVPTYSLYPVLAKLQNCKAIEIPFNSDFTLPASLEKTGAALTIVCNPNSPTGSFISPSKIANLAKKLKGVLLVDEAYIDFADENCLPLTKDLDNLIILRSMSKGYSLAGIRFGYAVAAESLIAGLLKLKDSYNVDAVAMAAATAAIKDQKYFKDNVGKIKKDREILAEKLCELKFIVPKSYSNFLLAESKTLPAREIYEKLVSRHIYVRYWNVPGLENKLRISVGTAEQNQRLIDALKEILNG
jgi:histidinol-phosphate aminotransferase